MKEEVPKELDELLGLTPISVHSAYLMDFYDSLNQLRDLYYYPIPTTESDENEKSISELKEDANNAYVQLINNGLHWEFCSFKVYKETYDSRKEEFLQTFYDADENDFLTDEHSKINELLSETISYIGEGGYPEETDISLISDFLNATNYKNIKFSNKKKNLFISEKISEINQPKDAPILNNLKWQGTPTELIELTKALIENETFKGQGTQKEIFIKIQNIFDIELKTIDKTINSFDEVRSGGNETKFLDALKASLLSNINIKRKKRENR